MKKTYSVQEVDDLREALDELYIAKRMRPVSRTRSLGYYQKEKADQIERELRTHILNGTEISAVRQQVVSLYTALSAAQELLPTDEELLAQSDPKIPS